MDKELKDIFQQSLSGIPESRLMTIVEIMADPEKHHRELLSLFETGNYKIHADNSREELLTMPLINEFRKGNDASISRRPQTNNDKFKFGYDWRVDIAKNGDVTVHLKEIDLRDTVTSKNDTVTTYTWTYGQGTIVHFLKEHPLSTYDNIRRIGLLNKAFFDIMSDRAHSISRYNLETAAWYKCLLTVFMRVGYEEYYDNVYDVSKMLRDQPRFLDIQQDTGKFYDGAL